MKRMMRLSSIMLLAAVALAACRDGDDDDDVSGGDPQDRFGQTFASAFNADENDEPIDPQPGDAGTLSLVDDPVDF